MAANGAVLGHYGEKKVKFQMKGEDEGQIAAMGFQVCDVTKPLVSVAKLIEKGNIIQFGPDDDDNFILHKRQGRR